MQIGPETAGRDDDAAFTTVARTRKPLPTKRRSKKGPQAQAQRPLEGILQEKRLQLRNSGYVASVADSLDESSCSKKRSEIRCMACYCFGLGSLRDSPKSLLQLALLLELTNGFTEPITFVDPAFLEEDIQFLEKLGHRAQLVDHNLIFDSPAFLYMPHCPRSLYESVLSQNSERLGHLLLLSNELTMYAERELRADILVQIPHLVKAKTILAFARLAEFEDRPDAFNDMAWQWSKDTDEQK